MKETFRFLNFWLSFSTWYHMWNVAKQCTKANMKQEYWDKWRWR